MITLTRRRSAATGACSARSEIIPWSSERYSWSISSSAAITCCASVVVVVHHGVDGVADRGSGELTERQQVELHRLELLVERRARHQPNRPVT